MRISEAWLVLLLALAIGTLTSSLARRGPDPLQSIVGAMEDSMPNSDHLITAPLGFALPDEGGEYILVQLPMKMDHRMCSARF